MFDLFGSFGVEASKPISITGYGKELHEYFLTIQRELVNTQHTAILVKEI